MSVTDVLKLNNGEMFANVRKGLPSTQQTQNLIDSKDDLLFAWDSKESCVLVLNWRAAQLKETKHQMLIPSTSQNFDVERLLVSNEGSLIALAGSGGIALLELPRRWGKDGMFLEGKPQVTCRTYCLDAQLFSNNPHLEIRQLRWHPGSTTDSHLLVLLSDNTIRLYNNAQLRHVWQVGPMPAVSKQFNANSSLGVFGETAVDFDIAPAVKSKAIVKYRNLVEKSSGTLNQSNAKESKAKPNDKIEWPIIILRENGNIYALMTGLDCEKARLQGPITITPQTVNNYGLDSCAILVIPSLPPTLVIAESNGKLHHALLLEAETSENSYSEIDASIHIEPSEWSVHVLETVELELGLPKIEIGNAHSFLCPIHLKRDYINELRYFAYHNTGLHVVSVNFIAELQRFLDSDSPDDNVSLSTPSSAEYLVCTKVDAGNRVNSVYGFALLQMPAGVVLLLGSGQVISLKLVVDPKLLVVPATCLWQNVSKINDGKLDKLITEPTFVDHIRGILKRSLTQPILSADKSTMPTTQECYELLNQAMEVLRAEYLKRHETARAEFSKRISRIQLQKEQQLREIETLENERENISERAHKLAERFEEINDNQEVLMNKCHELVRQANIALPGNVAAEREFAQDVARVHKSTKNMAVALENAKKSIQKQRYHIAKADMSSNIAPFELPEKQHCTITEILAQMATEIDRQINDIKRINKHIGI